MAIDNAGRWIGLLLLCAALIAVTIAFAVPAIYSPAVHIAIVIAAFVVAVPAAWGTGASALFSSSQENRLLALSGIQLILPWLLFAFLAGYGRPDEATGAENKLRYVVLIINTIAVTGGFVALRDALASSGQRVLATFGFGAILLAGAAMLVWGSFTLIFSAATPDSAGRLPPWFGTLSDISDVQLFFGGALTYVAAASFALALSNAKWLGHICAGAFVVASAIALICLSLRGVTFPDPNAAFRHWYTTVGWVVGIPAVPWIMPCVLGILMLRRAGSNR